MFDTQHDKKMCPFNLQKPWLLKRMAAKQHKYKQFSNTYYNLVGLLFFSPMQYSKLKVRLKVIDVQKRIVSAYTLLKW